MTSSMTRAAWPCRTGSDRPRALTTPAVTEPARPSGDPTATTSWPTTRASALPSWAGGGVVRAWSTARSDSGSTPITSNSDSSPSEYVASPLDELPTTWAFVSRCPSSVKTTADPPPRRSDTLAT
jgi:hypothetical protein